MLGRQLAAIPGLLDQRAEGGGGAGAFLLLLALVAVVAVAAESILRRILSAFRGHGWRSAPAPSRACARSAHLVLLALLDGLGVLAVWLICNAAIGAWFTGHDRQDRLAAAVLTGIFSWRLYVLLFRIVLQPDVPQARLCDVARCTMPTPCTCGSRR